MNIKEYLLDKNWLIKLKKMPYDKRRLIEDTIILQTPFLPQDASIKQRGWHIVNDVNCTPSCPECGGYLKFRKENVYGTFCSVKCAANSSITHKKRKQTEIEIHGSEEAFKKHKAEFLKKTSLKKYGVENMFQASEIKEKSKETLKINYGVDHPQKSKIIRDKFENTMHEKYGAIHAHQSKELRQKFTNTMNNRYGVDHALQSVNILESLKNSNNRKYNRNNYNQIKISDESIKKINDKNWLIEQHHNLKKTIESIADELEIDRTTLSRYFKLHNIELKRYGNSLPERELATLLEDSDIKFITNARDIIAPLELDIYIPDKKIAIEYCGLFWHCEDRKPKEYHKEKYDLCISKGIRLLTIFENEWLEKKELIKNKILSILGRDNSLKIFARKTNIEKISTNIKTEFFNKYHIQDDGISSLNYGLFYNNELVAAIGFRKTTDESYELNRYATSCKVVGGFSKLLKYFENIFENPKIITYADLRWSQGDLYKNNGFMLDKILKIDYYWSKDKKLWHKFNFRHNKMKNKLKNYDPELSETNNMHNHDYVKIWDCGKLRFIKINNA